MRTVFKAQVTKTTGKVFQPCIKLILGIKMVSICDDSLFPGQRLELQDQEVLLTWGGPGAIGCFLLTESDYDLSDEDLVLRHQEFQEVSDQVLGLGRRVSAETMRAAMNWLLQG